MNRTAWGAVADSLEVLDPVWGREDVLWPWPRRLADDLTYGTAGRWIEPPSGPSTSTGSLPH